tara:strand:- start:543 stop:1166 length:624 start_codon:yes stop_codon:yes gene_type:complete
MSHNKIKIGTAEPSRTSAITPALGDLNNVSESSLTNGDYLIYGASGWSNTPPAAVLSGTIFIGEGASQNYSGSNASGVGIGDDVEFYAASTTNSITGATITSASNWISSITLPAGTFKLYAVAGLELTNSSGLLEYRWHNGTSEIGATGNCGYTDDLVGNPAVVIVAPTTNTTYTVEIITATNVVSLASQTTRHSKRGYILIEEIRT